MKLQVKDLPAGAYAELRRKDGAWYVRAGDTEQPCAIDAPQLGRDSYKLLGLGDGTARVIRYADLHRHSDCSLLDGMSKISEIVHATEYAGALTDHGVMYGFLDYYKQMQEAGKKPIIGVEAYQTDMDGTLSGRHLILLAKNETGVKNLFKLTSESYDHFKRKPHVTWEMLEQYREGVLCTTACLGGLIPTLLRQEDTVGAKAAVERFLSIFGREDFYIEIQRHGIKGEVEVNAGLIRLAREYGVKLIAATDAHYPTKDDAYPHEVLMCISTQKTMNDPKRLRYEGSGYWLMDSEEMEELFADLPEALDNTLEIAEKCNVKLRLHDVNLPHYAIPDGYPTPMAYLRAITERGFRDRFKGTPHESDTVYRERLQYELDMIEQMGFASYFLIVWDFINYAREHGIYVGPGRGSAAGSLAAYCMGITDMDPIKYKLLFERFLNPERVSWPDIDTDIEYYRRSEVIHYLLQKYGAENVCRIVTFGTLAAKAAVKDVGRALGASAGYTSKLSGMIPGGVGMTIQKALDESQEFHTAYENDATARRIIDIAKRLEGNKRHASQHACGLALSPTNVSDYLPTSMEKDEETGEKALTSQVIMTEVEELSLIKMDLLGLKTLGVMHECLDRAQALYGKDAILRKIGAVGDTVRYQDIPLNDRATYEMLAKGLTGGVFQLESAGMTRLIQDMLSDLDTLSDERLEECFERLIAAVALYRPGPMDYIPDYIAGMKSPEQVHYDCRQERSILEPTYGVLVYQEQLMQIARELAGYSLARADILRKACGKKKKKLMDAEHTVFVHGNKADFDAGRDATYIPGCVANGIPEQAAEEIWEKMVKFASYAFNRSHAACYAWLSYLTAYMACHWTAPFYAAMANAFLDNGEKMRGYLQYAARRGITLLVPDVNESDAVFTADETTIRFGLQGIGGMKSEAAYIAEVRLNGGAFRDLQDLYNRCAQRGGKLTRKVAENLVYSGALASFGSNRTALLAQFDAIEKDYKKTAADRQLGQFSLFGETASSVIPMPDVSDISKEAALQREYDCLGLYLSGHPADDILEQMTAPQGYVSVEKLAKQTKEQLEVVTVGRITGPRSFDTKSGERMSVFSLETRFDTIRCVVFPKEYDTCAAPLLNGTVAGVCGDWKSDARGEGMQMIVRRLIGQAAFLTPPAPPVVAVISGKAEQDRVLKFIAEHPGDMPVCLEYQGKRYPLKQGAVNTIAAIEYLSGGFRSA